MKITQKEISHACFNVGQLEALILTYRFSSPEVRDVFYTAANELAEFLHKISEEVSNNGN